MNELPDIALSVRQPWAWAIIYAGKPVENRSGFAVTKGNMKPRRVAIHASKTMTRDEYESFLDFYENDIPRRPLQTYPKAPGPAELQRGGIIGSVDVVDVVDRMDSPWFFGPKGLVLKNPKPCQFVPCVGKLGYFRWQPADWSVVPQPAKWMLPKIPGPWLMTVDGASALPEDPADVAEDLFREHHAKLERAET